MKYFVQIMAGSGIAAFLVGFIMKLMGAPSLLNGAPVAWWRASVFFLLLGILYALVEIRDESRSG